MAYRDEPVIEAVQSVLVLLVPAALGLPCRKPDFVVRVVLERRELRDGIHLAAERYLSARKELLIFHGKVVLFLEKRDYRNVEALELELGVQKNYVSEFRGELIAELRYAKSPCPEIQVLLEFGVCLVPEQDFVIIKLVSCIYRVAYLRHC